jgi:hypothetical protein
MKRLMTLEYLAEENEAYAGSGGRSQENREYGFRPAFCDLQTATVYPCRFADGRPAPFHLIDGLPEEVVVVRSDDGRVVSVKSSVVAGFVLEGEFYTREAAVQAMKKRLN